MNILDFTAEETNLIAIYTNGSRTDTATTITATMPMMVDEMKKIAASSVAKLTAMSDGEFEEITFELVEDVTFDE